MSSYRTPGVYVEEISTLPGIISPVNTAVPVFIGYTELHDTNVAETVLTGNTSTHPVKIQSMAEYEALFGGPNFEVEITVADDSVIDALGASDSRADLVLSAEITDYSKCYVLYYSLKHYFQNGGGPCYIVSVRKYALSGTTKVDKTLIQNGVKAVDLEDEPTLIVMPDLAHVVGASYATRNSNYAVAATEALAQCKARKDRFVIMDLLNGAPGQEQEKFEDAIGTENLQFGAAYYPWLKSGFSVEGFDPKGVKFSQTTAGDFDGETLEYVYSIISGGGTEQSTFLQAVNDGFLKAIEAKIQEAGGNFLIPPSGAVAGIYCATDRNVGVWKSPANTSVAGASDVEFKYSPSELDGFNVPNSGSGKAINIIRPMQGRGLMVMGARTLDANSLEWRYISVRRLFLFLEESISKALDSLVFEANDQATWLRAKGMIENFLSGVWRNGGLQGGSPSQAFFVKVGLNETMSSTDVLEGRMIVEIGVAAVRPAEFIILKFSHKLQEA